METTRSSSYSVKFRKEFNTWLQNKYTDHNNKRFFVWLDGILYFKLTKWVCREWSDRTVDEIKRLYFGVGYPAVTLFRFIFLKEGVNRTLEDELLDYVGIVRSRANGGSK